MTIKSKSIGWLQNRTRLELVYFALFMFFAGFILKEFVSPVLVVPEGSKFWNLASLTAFSIRVIETLLVDIAIAIIIALTISVYLERDSREALIGILQIKSDRIARDVYSGIFGTKLPSEYVKEVIEQTFQVKILRDYMRVQYDLTPLIINSDRYVNEHFMRLTATAKWNYVCASSKDGGAEGVNVSLMLGLPNPMINELKEHVRIVRFKAGVEELDVRPVNIAIQEQLANDELVDIVADFGERHLKAGEQLKVEAVYEMIKEYEDTEFLRTAFPTKEMEITVSDQTQGANGTTLRVRAKATHGKITGGLLYNTGSNKYEWNIPVYTTPHQGIMFWWKKIPPVIKGP